MRLFIDRGYGFIETDGRQEVYFHAHAVHGIPFEKLAVGMVVDLDIEADRKFKALFAPPRRPRPPPHPPSPAPLHPGLLRAAPRAALARRRGVPPGGARRHATFAGAGQAPPHGIG